MSRYKPKHNIFKTLCSYAKNYVHEVKNSIKSSKIVKNCPQIVKNENFQKKYFFCSFYVIMSLHAKNFVCRSNGVACGQYKDKEEKNSEKNPVEWWIILIEMCKNMSQACIFSPNNFLARTCRHPICENGIITHFVEKLSYFDENVLFFVVENLRYFYLMQIYLKKNLPFLRKCVNWY